MSEYQNAKIYKIVSKNTDKCYVGSTYTELKTRLSGHITNFKRDGSTTSKHIIKFGEYEIVLIENHSCKNVKELETRERFYIESMNCVNKNIPGRTDKQYRLDNAAAINERNKQYYQDNEMAIKERHKQYRLDNAATILEKKNKKYNCGCGGKYTHVNTLLHKKTKKHLKYLESIN